MSQQTWAEYVYSLIWGATPAENAPPRENVQFCVTEDLLHKTRAKLRHADPRAPPKKYPSRIPHVEEMNQLAAAYRKEQRLMRKSC